MQQPLGATPPRARHRPSRREQILRAGLVELTERPPAEVTMADIAARAGVTGMALYYHFGTRARLTEAAVDHIGEALAGLVDGAAREAGSAEALAAALVDRFVEWLDGHPLDARFYFAVSVGMSPEAEERRREHQRRMVRSLVERLRHLRPATPPAEAVVTAISLLALLAETAATPTAGARATAHELAARITSSE